MREVLRPVGNKIVFADDWRLVAQATPSTVPASKPTGGTIRSNVAGDYDSPSGSTAAKLIIHWSKPIQFKGSTKYPFICVCSSGSLCSCTFDFTGSLASVGTSSLTRRIRAITADFDPTTLTWNNTVVSPGLTFGASEWTFGALTGGGSRSAGTSILSQESVSAVVPNQLDYRINSTAKMYGIICDVKGDGTIDIGATATINSNGARWPISYSQYPSKPFVFFPT